VKRGRSLCRNPFFGQGFMSQRLIVFVECLIATASRTLTHGIVRLPVRNLKLLVPFRAWAFGRNRTCSCGTLACLTAKSCSARFPLEAARRSNQKNNLAVSRTSTTYTSARILCPQQQDLFLSRSGLSGQRDG